MICLGCKRVYPPGMTICPHDGLPLVDHDQGHQGGPAPANEAALCPLEQLKTNIDRLFDRSGAQSTLEDEDLHTALDPPAGLTSGWLDAGASGEQSGRTQLDELKALPVEQPSADVPGRWCESSDGDEAAAVPKKGKRSAWAQPPQDEDFFDVPTNIQRRPELPAALTQEMTPPPLQDQIPPESLPSLGDQLGAPIGAELIGRELHGTYQATRLIAKGSMSSVFEGRHLRLPKKRLAIKMLNPMLRNLPEAYARFRREAEIATELGNVHIVEVLDFNITEEGHLYLVMEYLEGEDLAERIQREAPLPLHDVAQIVAQVADGLQAAHDQGIVHRDMKPGNIHLLAGGEITVKILDFGISKLKHTESMVTRLNMIVGTPYFMSPEQARLSQASVDHTTDIFALAGICYQMLTGALPFYAPTLGGILEHISSSAPRPLRELNPAVPEAAQQVLDRALAKDKDQRYQRVESFAQEFCQALLAGAPLRPKELLRPQGQDEVPRRPAGQPRPKSLPHRRAPSPTQPLLLSDLNTSGLLSAGEAHTMQSLRKQALAYVKTDPQQMQDMEELDDGAGLPPAAEEAPGSGNGKQGELLAGKTEQDIAQIATIEIGADELQRARDQEERKIRSDPPPLIASGVPEMPYAPTRPLENVPDHALYPIEMKLSVPAMSPRRQNKALIFILVLLVLAGLTLLFLVFQLLRSDTAPQKTHLSSPGRLAMTADDRLPALARPAPPPAPSPLIAPCSAPPGSQPDKPAQACWPA